MRTARTVKELRCFCGRHPLLATYGVDSDGKLYIHVKIYKQRRIFGEMLFKGGEVTLRCRDCLRWQRINIIDNEQQATLSVAKSSDIPGANSSSPGSVAP